MKRFALSHGFSGTFSTSTYRKVPMKIRLDIGWVLDIYSIFIDFHFVATAGVISHFFGMSYRDMPETIEVSYTSNQIFGNYKDLILYRPFRYSAPGEGLQDEWYQAFTPKPFTVWDSPTVVVGYSNIVGTVTPAAIYAEMFGDVRKASREEYDRLQVEQRQNVDIL